MEPFGDFALKNFLKIYSVLVIRPKLGVELNFEKLIKFLIMNYQID
jgi:hypothetical protein